MSVSPCSHFLFEPFHPSHTCEQKALSVITNIFLTIVTGGLYLILFFACNRQNREVRVIDSGLRDPFVGNEALKKIHGEYLKKFEAWAHEGKWEMMQGPHGAHFDWWMFPIDQESRGQGKRYQLSEKDRDALKADRVFMAGYRRGVVLVVKSWGWDLEQAVDCSNAKQKWTDYGVRLWKMRQSLRYFGEDDLLERLQAFIQAKGIHVRT